MWDLWSGESVFLPSQHEGNVTVTRHPPPHGLLGKPLTSLPEHGAPPNGFCSILDSHRKHRPDGTALALRLAASPTSMRNPWSFMLDFVYNVPRAVCHGRRSRDLPA